MIVVATVIAASGGIAALVRRSVKASRRARQDLAVRLTSVCERLEQALRGRGLEAVFYTDSRKVEGPRTKQIGQVQIWVNAADGTCTGCHASNPIELNYVAAVSACGAERVFIGDCCLACGRFVATKNEKGRQMLHGYRQAWLEIFSATAHLEDLLQHLERGDAPLDAKDLERRERELEGELGDVRLRLQGLRAACGELSDGPFRPRLVAKNE